MGIEIERKFLVDIGMLLTSPEFHTAIKKSIWQGYISEDPAIRIRQQRSGIGDQWSLTIKGKGLVTRTEIDLPIGKMEFEDLLGMCKSYVEKFRYVLPTTNSKRNWEVDVFTRCSKTGLVLAEIELLSETEGFERPIWLLEEVSNDPAYQNVNLTIPRSSTP